jgi:AcrR family transcriptional regulator
MARQHRHAPGSSPSQARSATPRLRRSERREQILAAATAAFARTGYAATSLEDIAAEAGVTRVILYRHFESKADLYRSVLDRAKRRLDAATGAPEFTDASIDALLAAAAEDPDGFRLLFHHAAREPAFKEEMDRLRAEAIAMTHRHLARVIPDRRWARWASELVPTLAIEAVTAWLDAGQPDRDEAGERIGQAIYAVIRAAAEPAPVRSPVSCD